MPETGDQAHIFDLTAGQLCLDFVNTVGGDRRSRPSEHLHGYADLLAWSEQAGVLTPMEGEALRQTAADRPAEAAVAHARALALREALYRLFSAIAGGDELPVADLAALNASLAAALPHRRVTPVDDGFAWGWAVVPGALDRPLWTVVVDAAELLTAGELERVRECASDTCGWLFFDLSRNRSRRWCDMADCGNRAKARRHYERRRAARAVRP